MTNRGTTLVSTIYKTSKVHILADSQAGKAKKKLQSLIYLKFLFYTAHTEKKGNTFLVVTALLAT